MNITELQYNCNCVAVLSDIHSNDVALDACLTDAKQAGADCFVFLGDYVSGLAAPVKTMDLVYEIRNRYPTCCIRGNRERYIMDHRSGVNVCVPGSNTGTFLFTSDQLREEDLRFFAQLPFSGRITINGVVFEIAHATTENDRYYFEKGDTKIDGVMERMDADFLLCGHSHKQYDAEKNGKRIINPGSVGQPQGGGCHAQYLLLTVKDHAVSCEFRQVPYDVERVIQNQFESGLFDVGKCWAISDLYATMTGEGYTKMLLEKVYGVTREDKDMLGDESLWSASAASLGMKFTMEEVRSFYRERNEQ